MCFINIVDICFITDLNSIVSDTNNKINDCVKDIKIEQNDLDKTHTAEKNISIEQSEGKNF